MQTIIKDILEKFDSLSIEDQESILEIERKRMNERKRKLLVEEVREAEIEYKDGKFIEGDAETLMKAIENEL
ncbi:MAG: hypothetical protein IPL53_09205 [Ignavibacteria bacterium]|nr:hypothetical protein [Ignavibacteria bacterium]